MSTAQLATLLNTSNSNLFRILPKNRIVQNNKHIKLFYNIEPKNTEDNKVAGK